MSTEEKKKVYQLPNVLKPFTYNATSNKMQDATKQFSFKMPKKTEIIGDYYSILQPK